MGKDIQLHFSDDIKNRWIVRRDECHCEYIALNGKNALGKNGHDHIYLINKQKAGLWITSKQINQKIKTLQGKVPSLTIEQLGDNEAVISVPIDDMDALCAAAKAKKRKKLSKEQLRRLRDNIDSIQKAQGVEKNE